MIIKYASAVNRDEVDHAAMRNALIREIKSLLTMSSVNHVTSIYFGGGKKLFYYCYFLYCLAVNFLANSMPVPIKGQGQYTACQLASTCRHLPLVEESRG